MDAGEHEGTYCHLIMNIYLYIPCSHFKRTLINFLSLLNPKVGMTTTLRTQ